MTDHEKAVLEVFFDKSLNFIKITSGGCSPKIVTQAVNRQTLSLGIVNRATLPAKPEQASEPDLVGGSCRVTWACVGEAKEPFRHCTYVQNYPHRR